MSPLRRRLLDYALVAALLFIPGAMLSASLKERSSLSAFDQAILRISSPLQAVAAWIIEGVGGIWNGYVWLVDVEDENDELRRANEGLRQALAVAERRVVHTELLEELAGLRRERPAETLGARVVASSVNPYFRVTRVRLDRGDPDLRPGMAVISDQGLVGRIQRVYGEYSDVLLTVDAQSSIDVLVPRIGLRGVLTGLGGDASYGCKIEYLEREQEVREGDVVVTSGLGSAFPADLVVGNVVAVNAKEYGLYQDVVVAPSVDFSALGRVLVVLSPPPPPDPEPGTIRSSAQAFTARPYQ
jgi:rod shape-determining protein MreC